MQLYEGKKTRPSRVTAMRAGSYDQPEPLTGADKRIAALQEMERQASIGYGPEEFAKQVYNFPGALYNDADQMVRGLIDIPRALFRGADPGDMAYEAAQGQLDAWSHPVDYANEHPLGFTLDAAALAGGLGALDKAAFAGRMLPEGPQSIGAVGRRLAEGDLPVSMESLGSQMTPTYEYSAAAPDIAMGRWADDSRGLLVSKVAQSDAEAAASAINEATGAQLRMPAVATYENLPYTPKELSLGRGANNLWAPGEPIIAREGSISEFVPNLRNRVELEDLDWSNPATADQMRRMQIFDEIISNDDRVMGSSNMHMTVPDRVPIAVDQGSAFKSRFLPETYAPQAWPGGTTLSPSELDWVNQIKQVAPGILQANYGNETINALLERIQNILSEGQLHPDTRAWGY